MTERQEEILRQLTSRMSRRRDAISQEYGDSMASAEREYQKARAAAQGKSQTEMDALMIETMIGLWEALEKSEE